MERGEHLKLYRFSPDDYKELRAVFNGPHPESPARSSSSSTSRPEGVPAHDLPPQPAVFAPDYAPEEIAEIARKLRVAAGLPKEPSGVVASSNGSAPQAQAGAEEVGGEGEGQERLIERPARRMRRAGRFS